MPAHPKRPEAAMTEEAAAQRLGAECGEYAAATFQARVHAGQSVNTAFWKTRAEAEAELPSDAPRWAIAHRAERARTAKTKPPSGYLD